MSNQPINDEQAIARLMEARGVRPTYQRLMVARALFARREHLTADQIHEQLKTGDSGCSRATVYNTLKLFVRRGLINEVIVDPARTYYDSITEPHHHIYNVDTGELTDVDPQHIRLDGTPPLPGGTVLEAMNVVIRVRKAPG